MEFSVVESGYDRRQVDTGLSDLADRLEGMAGRAAATARSGPQAGLALVCEEVAVLTTLLRDGRGPIHSPSHRMQQLLTAAEEEAAALLARARAEVAAAEQEAARIRDRAYAEALQARRDCEAALLARRQRAERADAILAGIGMTTVPMGVAGSAERTPAQTR